MAVKYKILIVDDHPLTRGGLRQLLDSHADFHVCGDAGDQFAAIAAVKALDPNLVIADVALEAGNGLDLARQLRQVRPRLPVLIYSMHDEDVYAPRAVMAGARGYLRKDAPADELIKAVRCLLSGGLYAREDVVDRVLNSVVGSPPPLSSSPVDLLSNRELEIFMLIGEGFRNKPIAKRLCLSISTVETYQAHIKRKLGLSGADQLTRYAIHWSRSRAIGEVVRSDRSDNHRNGKSAEPKGTP